MARDVLWAPWATTGLEHLRLEVGDETISADGAIIAIFEGEVVRASYQITSDTAWRVREVQIQVSHPADIGLHIRMDGGGRWISEIGGAIPALDGCVDVDFAATPFTNTLPIRRLDLQAGESAEIAVVYIDAPSVEVTPVRQRYTCLARGADGARYRFEALPYPALPDGFVAELTIDADGLVREYPPLFRRVWIR